MTPNIVDLSRTEVSRLATVLEALVARHGTYEAAAQELKIGKPTIVRILARPGALRMVRGTLQKIATGAGPLLTVEQVLAGQVRSEMPTTGPARRARGSVVVRRGSRR